MTGYLRPRILARLDGMAARLQELTARSADPEVLARPEGLASIHRELGALTRTVDQYELYRKLLAQIEDNRSLMEPGGDPELSALAAAELPDLEVRAEGLADEIIDALLAEEGDNQRDAIVEIRAGTGGEEAALFARDLFELYRRFAERVGWKIEMLGSNAAEMGGLKEAVFAVRGENVFHQMRFESGGHRVQRVPATESQGRIHTSAATVAVLAEAEDVEVLIDDKELRVDTYRSSGAGGQHVNKTDSAVRITHLPTGIVVACQDERSQHKNRARAMKLLRARIYDEEQRRRDQERAAERKGQVGSGDRSQRIRTYNFPQDRLTDHRLSRNFPLAQVMEGKLEPVLEALLADERQRRLEQM